MCPLFNNTADDWHTQKKRLISGKMNSYEGLREKIYHHYCNHMSSVAETSFFRPKMSGFLILNWGGRLTRTEQLTDFGLIPYVPNLIPWVPTLIPRVPTLIPHTSTLIPCVPTLILSVPTLIPRIPTLISHVPTLIPSIPTLIPCLPIISFIPFPDSPFRLLQVAYFFKEHIQILSMR